jgi:predicted metal-dependent phosphoesterase TrpH
MIDLHTHSTASDGGLSPAALVAHAAAEGITALALTDHDTVAGLAEARAAAAEAGVRFISGVELNIEWAQGEFHLLGLGLRRPSAELSALIGALQTERRRRNEEIFRLLRSEYPAASLAELAAHLPGGTVGRPHIADYLVEKGIAADRQDAFDRFLSKGRRYYAEHAGAKLADAVRAIRASGGRAVIAHPLSLHVSWSKFERLLRYFRKAGIEGLEAWHPGARAAECARFEALAGKAGLFVTAGSDFHGEGVRARCAIGHTADGIPIAQRFLPEVLRG